MGGNVFKGMFTRYELLSVLSPSNPVHCYIDESTLHNAPASHKNRVDIALLINLDLC